MFGSPSGSGCTMSLKLTISFRFLLLLSVRLGSARLTGGAGVTSQTQRVSSGVLLTLPPIVEQKPGNPLKSSQLGQFSFAPKHNSVFSSIYELWQVDYLKRQHLKRNKLPVQPPESDVESLNLQTALTQPEQPSQMSPVKQSSRSEVKVGSARVGSQPNVQHSDLDLDGLGSGEDIYHNSLPSSRLPREQMLSDCPKFKQSVHRGPLNRKNGLWSFIYSSERRLKLQCLSGLSLLSTNAVEPGPMTSSKPHPNDILESLASHQRGFLSNRNHRRPKPQSSSKKRRVWLRPQRVKSALTSSTPGQRPQPSRKYQVWASQKTNYESKTEKFKRLSGRVFKASPKTGEQSDSISQLHQRNQEKPINHKNLTKQLFGIHIQPRDSRPLKPLAEHPAPETSQSSTWLFGRHVHVTTKSRRTRELGPFPTAAPQNGRRHERDNEASPTHPRFITVPPLGKDRVVSGKAFFTNSGCQTQNGGFSQSLPDTRRKYDQNEFKEPSTKPAEQTRNAAAPPQRPKPSFPPDRRIKPIGFPENSIVGLQFQPSSAQQSSQSPAPLVQISFRWPQSSVQIHRNDPEESHGQLGPVRYFLKPSQDSWTRLFPASFGSQNVNLRPPVHQPSNQSPKPPQQTSDVKPSRSHLLYANPNSNQQSPWDSFSSSAAESWSFPSANPQENVLNVQSWPSSQTSQSFTQTSQLPPTQQRSLSDLKPGYFRNVSVVYLPRREQLQSSGDARPSVPSVQQFHPVAFSPQFSPPGHPIQLWDLFQKDFQKSKNHKKAVSKPRHQFGSPEPQTSTAEPLSTQKSWSTRAPSLSGNVPNLFLNPHRFHIHKPPPFRLPSLSPSPQRLGSSPGFLQRGQYGRSQIVQSRFPHLSLGLQSHQNSPGHSQTPAFAVSSRQKTPFGSYDM